jgi:hypothetical protein
VARRRGVSIEVIAPKDANFGEASFNRTKVRLLNYMRGPGARKLQGEFRKTSDGWSRPPEYPARVTQPYGGARIQLIVFPAGRGSLNWVRISEGTGPREIRAKSSGKPMVFQPGYNARTRPGGSWGRSKSRFGPVIRARVVFNHRIEPRKFAEAIAARIGNELTDDIRRIFAKGILK